MVEIVSDIFDINISPLKGFCEICGCENCIVFEHDGQTMCVACYESL